MGVDCKLKINDTYIGLDRYDIFSLLFKSKEIYKKDEALKKINNLMGNIKNIKPTWGDGSDRSPYFFYWLNIAEKAIKESPENAIITIFKEHDVPDEYFDN